MKKWACTLLALISGFSAWAQNQLGTDNLPVLNSAEVQFFASLEGSDMPATAYTNKQLAFIAGVNGNLVLRKSEFFHRYLLQGHKPILALITLTSAEQAASGGYQVLVLMPVKVFTRKQKEKIISQLANQGTALTR